MDQQSVRTPRLNTDKRGFNVRVNPASENGTNKDEVYVTNENPYVNYSFISEPGRFQNGEYTADEIEQRRVGKQED